MRTGEPPPSSASKIRSGAEGLARAVELLSAKVHAMPSPAGDVEPFAWFVVQIAVGALSLLPDRGAGLLRDLGELAARERRPGRAGSPRPRVRPAWWPGRLAGIAMCYITR